MTAELNVNVPHSGRRYDYLLGGKDNFAADRASADLLREELPQIRTAIRENREFVLRAVRYLAAEAGVRQFLDIGCGMPTGESVHDVAQAADPAARVVYVDNDPLIMAHARALLTGNGVGDVGYLEADLMAPREIISAARLPLDFSRPVGVLLCAVLHFIEDDAEAAACVRELVAALPSGSYVAISHATVDPLPVDVRAKVEEMVSSGAHGPFRARTWDQVAGFLAGLEPVEPGLVSTSQWRPFGDVVSDPEALAYAAVARKP